METFAITFVMMLLIVSGMAIGVIVVGRQKSIKGSCGGLNAVAGADKCLVCKKDIDPDSPLRERLQCPRARKMLDEMNEA